VILERVFVRAFAWHRYFRFFLSLLFWTPPNEFFHIQAYFTGFDYWPCYFRNRLPSVSN
jgi:hypothetical protein